jgi:hypothetical protein
MTHALCQPPQTTGGTLLGATERNRATAILDVMQLGEHKDGPSGLQSELDAADVQSLLDRLGTALSSS